VSFLKGVGGQTKCCSVYFTYDKFRTKVPQSIRKYVFHASRFDLVREESATLHRRPVRTRYHGTLVARSSRLKSFCLSAIRLVEVSAHTCTRSDCYKKEDDPYDSSLLTVVASLQKMIIKVLSEKSLENKNISVSAENSRKVCGCPHNGKSFVL
jgi:hypothetical protein